MEIVEQDALYYPYVHFPDEAWLKAALLLTPHVYRMVAQGYQPRWDTPFMWRVRRIKTNDVPLLEHAELWSTTATEAQTLLLQRLKTDIDREGPAFVRRFGQAAARAVATNDAGFQMHPGKMAGNLAAELRELGLAWTPEHPDDGAYVELHPTIGETVLGSIAVACAADCGLSVVGDGEDKASQELNRLAPAGDYGAVYDRFIHGVRPRKQPSGGTGQAAVDILLFQHCDASALEPEDLVDLSAEREPIVRLKARLHDLASKVPPMLDDKLRAKKLREAVADALDEWQRDRPSFRGALRRFFGVELASSASELAKGSMEKVAELRDSSGSAGAALSLGGAAGHFLGPLAGFGVAIVVHGVGSVASEFAAAQRSPYRYLSLAEEAGVVWSIGGVAAATGETGP
jgi:hypothetical protein